MEIERKFLLTRLPAQQIEAGLLVIRSEQRIEQTYLAMDDNQELRVRRLKDIATGNESYTHTFKKGNGIMREEVEYSISEGIYEQIISAFDYKPLTKNRLTGEWNGVTIEADIYDQIELIVLEVEFESLDAANAFVPPDWFGEDISSKKQYSNKTVWKSLQDGKFG